MAKVKGKKMKTQPPAFPSRMGLEIREKKIRTEHTKSFNNRIIDN